MDNEIILVQLLLMIYLACYTMGPSYDLYYSMVSIVLAQGKSLHIM